MLSRRIWRYTTGIAFAGLLSSCVNGNLSGPVKAPASSSLENSGGFVDPSPIGAGGSLSVEAAVVGSFTNPFSGSPSKGVLLNIQRSMEVLSRGYGGLSAMLKLSTSDTTFGARIMTILVQPVGAKIELPLARLHAGNGTLFNGIIIRPDGRISLVHSHVLPDARAAVRQTHSDRISVYGGTVNSDPSDRVIRLPLNGGVGSPGLNPDPAGAVLFSFRTDTAVAISANPDDLPAGTIRENMRNIVNDMRFLNRTAFQLNAGDPACVDPANINVEIDRLLSSQSSAFVISRRLVNGVNQPDEVMLCGDDANGKLLCKPYCWAFSATPAIQYCGQNRMILGCDTIKRGFLAPIVQSVAQPEIPTSVPLLVDPDGSGQIRISPL